jgi:hypothetical protein
MVCSRATDSTLKACAGEAAQVVGNRTTSHGSFGTDTTPQGCAGEAAQLVCSRATDSGLKACAGEAAQKELCSAGILPAFLTLPQSAHARSACCADESAQKVGNRAPRRSFGAHPTPEACPGEAAQVVENQGRTHLWGGAGRSLTSAREMRKGRSCRDVVNQGCAGVAAPFVPQGKQEVGDRTAVSSSLKRRSCRGGRDARGAWASAKRCCAGEAAQKELCRAGILPAFSTFCSTAPKFLRACAGVAAQIVCSRATDSILKACAGGAAPFVPQGKQSVRDRTTVSRFLKGRSRRGDRDAKGAFCCY